MKKKLFYILLVLIITNIIIINQKVIIKKEIILEDYQDLIIKDDLNLNVHEKYNLKDLVTFKNESTIINDKVIDTNEIGLQEIEIIYLNKEKEKRKSIININVVDKIKPLILGSSTYKVKLGNDLDLRYMFLSVDNYDKNPLREVIGEYDYNKIGSYDLLFKVTDSSNNISTRKMVINVVSKIDNPKKISNPIKYEDIYLKYKKENTKVGLDVSRWQENIDFIKLKELNVEFVILRIGFQKGFQKEIGMDSYFTENIKKAIEAGIPVGLYFYSYATSLKEAEEQALWIIDNIKESKVELPIAFDWESFSSLSKQNLSIFNLNQIAIKFMSTIDEHGYKGMNYSSKSYLENIWNIEDYPVWLAHYTTETTYKGKYYIWQMTDQGKIPGIVGNVDINIMYEEDL